MEEVRVVAVRVEEVEVMEVVGQVGREAGVGLEEQGKAVQVGEGKAGQGVTAEEKEVGEGWVVEGQVVRVVVVAAGLAALEAMVVGALVEKGAGREEVVVGVQG
jgi:hypothetical protein